MALTFAASPASGQVRPPNFSPDAIPETSFTCEDKITGGYYADQETECQLFHVCVQVSEYEVSLKVFVNVVSSKLHLFRRQMALNRYISALKHDMAYQMSYQMSCMLVG